MGDRTYAVALEIAERKLNALGWSWGPEQLGEYAARILAPLENEKGSADD